VLVVPRHDPGRGVRLDPCTAMCGYTPSFTKQKGIYLSSWVIKGGVDQTRRPPRLAPRSRPKQRVGAAPLDCETNSEHEVLLRVRSCVECVLCPRTPPKSRTLCDGLRRLDASVQRKWEPVCNSTLGRAARDPWKVADARERTASDA
jgi:hypothetical protein